MTPPPPPLSGAPVLVTGATGTVGREVTRLLNSHGVPVRATRRADEKGNALDPAVEYVDFDFTDPATWDEAFVGVRRMFLMRPPHLGRPKTQMLPALEHARAHGVQHVVLLSLQGAERNPVVPHATLERWLRTSGMSWTFVRASFFMQNLTGVHRADIRDRDELVVPAGTGATAFVDAHDVAAVAAAALADPAGHHNVAWTPTGPEALTYAQVARLIGEAVGRPIRYTQPGAVRYFRHARRALDLPTGMALVTTAIYTAARLGLADGLTDDVAAVLGRPPVSFAEFAAREAGVWSRPTSSDR